MISSAVSQPSAPTMCSVLPYKAESPCGGAIFNHLELKNGLGLKTYLSEVHFGFYCHQQSDP